ncbi:MAG: ATP-binding protein [Desulfobacteraceae bacterium]|nr:ATP-binding protein [Desulfobacteraceae bacterium]
MIEADRDRPLWVREMTRLHDAQSCSFFILHGNVDDSVGSLQDDVYRLESLADYLGLRHLQTYDLVLHYDLGRGLRIHPGGDEERESRMKALLGRMWPGLTRLPREPTPILRLMDRLAAKLLDDEQDGIQRKTAFLFDYADLLCPAGAREPEHLATMLNWARNPKLRRSHFLFILMCGSLTRLDPDLVQSAHTTEILVPMPNLAERKRMVRRTRSLPEDQAGRLASLSAGLTLINLESLLRLSGYPPTDENRPTGEAREPSPEKGQPDVPPSPASASVDPGSRREEDWEALTQAKKQLIESQCPGLLEFVEPHGNLDWVAGHRAAKKRLAEDARLIRAGRLDAVPMGYLLCGPVGVGKTFMAMCYAGSVGIPCVTLKNFRSKYVGETEANLEKILRVLRELGPVAVIIDEADAAVGNRGQSGDSGTSSRVFAQLAAQMGNTRFRGQTVWFLLTCRPDLLPVDLKRQGRCEEHIPLFYPESQADWVDMFLAMGKKLDLELTPGMVPDSKAGHPLSGADIESLLTRVKRESLIREQAIDRDLIQEVLHVFRSPRSPEHELQILAAVMECSDLRYLPEAWRAKAATHEGWQEINRRFALMSMQLVDR